MKPWAYYNEIDPEKAAWIRELIKANVVAPGEVDERDIKLVQPEDLKGFTQCHFFAGIAVWSYALRLAGWPDDRPAWTGSCPCGPFSIAGKKAAFADERHLWPWWFYLIEERRPGVIFGEQVEAAVNHGWLDLVQDDMEGIDYAFAPFGLPAAGVGAPHIRPRIYFVADSESQRVRSGLCDSKSPQLGRSELTNGGILGDTIGQRLAVRQEPEKQRRALREEGSSIGSAESLYGFWRNSEWIKCRDGKQRAIKPGIRVLADGSSSRVLRLRGYGDAINAEVAKTFIEAYCEARIEP